MTFLEAFILAVVEGLTEFLPVSSTGHMIIASTIMGIEASPLVKLFTVCIQFGAILSVVVMYKKKFFTSLHFYFKLFVAFLPAAFFGLVFKKTIDSLLENVLVVGIALFVGGIVLLFIDRILHPKEDMPETEDISFLTSLKIGMFQVVSMIPGVSRSAATIVGGMTQGLSKTKAAEFSFFLAVPTMFAATCKDLLDFYQEGNSLAGNEIGILIFGNLVAFIVAYLAIQTFITYLTKHGFKIFGYYRIIIGAIIIGLHLAHVNMHMF